MVATVVALPGTLCPPEIFDLLDRELGDAVEVDVVPWLTGPGPWTVSDIARTVAGRIESRSLGPVCLCGHSTGGAIALELALERPDLVAGLLLTGTGASMTGHGDVDAIIRRVDVDWGASLRADVLDRSFAEPLPPELRRRWLTWSDAVRQDAVAAVLASQAAVDFRPRLTDLAVPTHVVHGVHDRARSIADARELAALIPAARLTVVDAGHSAMHEAPTEVANALRALAVDPSPSTV
ncbi:alpha/beta fold hydrolase [Curtobacterium sp. AB7]|uniref:alpha/beta fold hydrolase n=1 Tax=Curtobacterium sp. AB7 TaxID=3349327 RepID=UPI0038343735